jgi:hypothetical protein
MNGRSCHLCLYQLDCLASDCGLTFAVEVAARKHDVVLHKVKRVDMFQGFHDKNQKAQLAALLMPKPSSSLLRAD